ncbi:hypothetical protein [Streptomyces sp. NBC_01601]|uniref:hypothetical protein n=1 Tax=Streptomyces sp. NBC_01601 TaxID=2975892 RepID=UPI002E2C766B|nr:hypothetical protein [Streptomyces sp. NBC_01601]
MIEKALQAADEQQEAVVRAVFRAAGLLWQCKRRSCLFDNSTARELCEKCGRQRNGRRIQDDIPVSAHPDDFELLREALKEYFAQAGADLPDAVTFTLKSEKRWSRYDATLHFGPRVQSHDFDREVGMALDDLGRAYDFGESLRVALYR